MKILIIQQRYGIGDMVIFFTLYSCNIKKFNVKVSFWLKKVHEHQIFLAEDDHIKEIIILDKEKDG